MKSILSIVTAVMVLVMIPAIALAQTSDTTTTIEERIAERQANRTDRITGAIQTRVEARCVIADGVIEAAISEARTVRERRVTAYNAIDQKVDEVTLLAGSAGADTSGLETVSTTFTSQVEAFFADFDVYQQSLSDASQIECSDDAEAYYYAVSDARTQKRSLKADSKVIRELVQGDMRSEMQAIRDQLTTDGES